MKMAVQYWINRGVKGRTQFVAFKGGYHGDTVGAVSLGHIDLFHKAYRSLLFKTDAVMAPYCYRCPFGLTYPNCNLRCAKDVEELIQTTTDGQIAAFIAEPILGVGGFITPPPEYFREVTAIIRRYGGILIADEVQTGWGRTGDKWFGIEHWGVEPDIMTSAKGMANGSPIGWTK
jgi:4-aminobutyrate aminotransferase